MVVGGLGVIYYAQPAYNIVKYCEMIERKGCRRLVKV